MIYLAFPPHLFLILLMAHLHTYTLTILIFYNAKDEQQVLKRDKFRFTSDTLTAVISWVSPQKGKPQHNCVVSTEEVRNISKWLKAGSRLRHCKTEHWIYHIFDTHKISSYGSFSKDCHPDYCMLYRVSTSQCHRFFFYHQAELPKWILSSLCHQSGKIRLIRDGVMLALHTIAGTEGAVEVERKNNKETNNKGDVLMLQTTGKTLSDVFFCVYREGNCILAEQNTWCIRKFD